MADQPDMSAQVGLPDLSVATQPSTGLTSGRYNPGFFLFGLQDLSTRWGAT